jgi:hypothetical protein
MYVHVLHRTIYIMQCTDYLFFLHSIFYRDYCYSNTIICIILYHTIFTIIVFQAYYITYLFPCTSVLADTPKKQAFSPAFDPMTDNILPRFITWIITSSLDPLHAPLLWHYMHHDTLPNLSILLPNPLHPLHTLDSITCGQCLLLSIYLQRPPRSDRCCHQCEAWSTVVAPSSSDFFSQTGPDCLPAQHSDQGIPWQHVPRIPVSPPTWSN